MLLNSIVVKSKEKFHTAVDLMRAYMVSSRSTNVGVAWRGPVREARLIVLVELMVRLHFSKSIDLSCEYGGLG